MDTNLSLLYRGKTIDTTSWAKIKVAKINEGKTFVLNAPPLFVNKTCCSYKSLLFVHSALRANNENSERFNAASVIDVYDIMNGVYKFSFYLYDFGGQKIREIGIYHNFLIALHDHYLVTYYLDQKIFN